MESLSSQEKVVQGHYARPDLAQILLDALAAAGKDINHLQPEDLAPVDEFHIRGRQATRELAQQLNLKLNVQVLDVGCGIGGASRYLASEYGCQVTGLDLTEDYIRVARLLAERVGLGPRLHYQQGNALALPFPDTSFDLVWTQHATMNISDKARLYAEIGRVLRIGGFFAMYDAVAGPCGAPLFPVPWAADPSYSFLATPDELRHHLELNHLRLVSWRDTSAEGIAWFKEMAARGGQTPGTPPALGLHYLMGSDFQLKGQNMMRNLAEKRVMLVECIAQRLPDL
jgi:SAM-dependent methyltransferase